MSQTKKYICDCGEVYSSLAAIESCQSHHNHNQPDLAAINAELVAALKSCLALAAAWAGYYAASPAYPGNGKIHPEHKKTIDSAKAILARVKGEK